MATKKAEEKVEIPEEKLKGKALEKAAEAESTNAPIGVPKSTDLKDKTETSLEDKKKALLEKVKKLKKKVDVTDTKSLKEEVKAKKRAEMLIPLDDYVKTGIYLGTRVVTPDMKPYVYRRRADGLAIFNTDLIDEKLKEGIAYLSKFNPEDVILVCKRQAGWKAAKKFEEITGIRVFTKKYPGGILTNTQLGDFFENELTIVSDSWLDKNALKDTLGVKKKVLMICGTNNFAKGADQIIIGNNKSGKSLGLIFYLLSRGYLKARDGDLTKVPDMEWWIEESS
jgi:small subunit ribosomal protein S2